MREIKYRIWVPPNTWHPAGDLYLRADGKLCLDISKHRKGWHPDTEPIVEMPNTSSFRICQFTGLKDKNGREIYEGDIIKLGDGKVGTVQWDELHTGFSVHTPDDGSYSINFRYYGKMAQEIIGNIYEDPELLKEAGQCPAK